MHFLSTKLNDQDILRHLRVLEPQDERMKQKQRFFRRVFKPRRQPRVTCSRWACFPLICNIISQWFRPSFVSILEIFFPIFQQEEEEEDIPFCLVDIRGDVIRARKLQSRDNDDSHSILHSFLLLWSSLPSQHYEHQSTLQMTHLAVIKVLETLDPDADGEYTKNTRTRHIVWLGPRLTWLSRILAPMSYWYNTHITTWYYTNTSSL